MTTEPRRRDLPPADARGDVGDDVESVRAVPPRPRWLMPGVVVVLVGGALVAAGIVPLSAALTAVMFGGMILMHLGGHGMHGGHGGHGGGHAGRGRVGPGAAGDGEVGPGGIGSDEVGPGAAGEPVAPTASDSDPGPAGDRDERPSSRCH